MGWARADAITLSGIADDDNSTVQTVRRIQPADNHPPSTLLMAKPTWSDVDVYDAYNPIVVRGQAE